jgi:hypothetical protein
VGRGKVVSLYVAHLDKEIWGELVNATPTEVALVTVNGPVFVTTDEIQAFRRCDSTLTIRDDLREKYREQCEEDDQQPPKRKCPACGEEFEAW